MFLYLPIFTAASRCSQCVVGLSEDQSPTRNRKVDILNYRQQRGPVEETMGYTKHFIPLESNPDLFTQLIHILGVSSNLVFQDVLSLDSDMLALIPRPVLALILVFPTSEVYEKEKAIEEFTKEDYKGRGETEDVTWFKQTINNACGFYGILHAICNGEAREMIGIRTAHVQMKH